MSVAWPVSALLLGGGLVVLVCCFVNLSLEPSRMAGHWSDRVGLAAFAVVMVVGVALLVWALVDMTK